MSQFQQHLNTVILPLLSSNFYPVDSGTLLLLYKDFLYTSKRVDTLKKALFYGKEFAIPVPDPVTNLKYSIREWLDHLEVFQEEHSHETLTLIQQALDSAASHSKDLKTSSTIPDLSPSDDKYQGLLLFKEAVNDVVKQRFLHAILGVIDEGFELLFNTDKTNLLEELGDLSFFFITLLEYSRQLTDSSLSLEEWIAKILTANRFKLKTRYGSSFDSSKAINRDKEAERKAIENSI